jgi:glycosyltransferase involved in cell wall biosynthesis
MLKFAFLHLQPEKQPSYDGRDFKTGSVSGTQAGTMLLAEALVRRGHEVTIFNKRAAPVEVNGVLYRPLAEAASVTPDTVAVSNNSISVLGQAPTRRRVVWGRLDLRLARLRKKHDIMPVLRIRPHLVVPSRYSARRTQFIIPFRSRRIIEHGIDATFLRFEPSTQPPPPVAVFASQPGRNLNLVLQAWREQIHPKLPAARLHLYLPKLDQHPGYLENAGDMGVEIKGSVSKQELAQAFRDARVMIYPGHKEETFCNAAAEAVATGLPLVTMGIGALAERVRHGVDGFVAPTVAGMGEYALQVLRDDALWRKLHPAGIEISRTRSWDTRAGEWEKAAASWV